ncbi:YopT-type cysteine protease domain-containing protein [Pseudomonas indica]|uniref:Cysteine protease domain-containing protein, YopT-type n=2 Tax=Pseudomonas indica TaxID=137658 RepID=A0A1G9ADM8_9PSED|nr:YopT-type cysteine protease domain-containing protein [Pseudomonas indica]SDK25381.1 cysteine protease domain-containing protein, YopT-type [Pseudomonas indica]
MTPLHIGRGQPSGIDTSARQDVPLPLDRVANPEIRPPVPGTGMTPLTQPLPAPLPLPPPSLNAARPVSATGNAGASPHLPPFQSPELSSIAFMHNVALQHGCTLSLPFNQREARLAVLKTIEGVDEHIDAATQDKGLCFGLSLNWLKNAAEGHDNAHFVEAFQAWDKDSLFLRSVGLQHIELETAIAQHSSNALRMFQSTLPAAGFQLHGMGAVDLEAPNGIQVLGEAVNALGRGSGDRYFMLCSSEHAMALHKDASGHTHFFDPNGGVVSTDNIAAMARVVRDVLLQSPTYWAPGKGHNLIIFEAKPGGAAGSGRGEFSERR